MPFIKLEEVELNVIWVGPKLMPESYMNNLYNNIINKNPKATIKIWFDSKDALHAFVMAFAKKKFSNQHNNITYKVINYDELNIPEEIRDILDDTVKVGLPACYSDIIRLFILARPLESGSNRHARFYIEPDNYMSPDLWDKFDNKDVCTLYMENQDEASNAKLSLMMRTDMLFLDITSPAGMQFQNNLPTNMRTLLLDDTLKSLYAYQRECAVKNNGLHFIDVMAGTGALIQAIFRLEFVDENESEGKIYGLAKHLIPTDKLMKNNFFVANQYRGAHRSWENPVIILEPVEKGLVYRSMMVRYFQLSDPTGTILVDYLKNGLKGLNIKSIEEFYEYVKRATTILYLGREKPDWCNALTFKKLGDESKKPQDKPKLTA